MIFIRIEKSAAAILSLALAGAVFLLAFLPAQAYVEEPAIDNEAQSFSANSTKPAANSSDGKPISLWRCGFIDKQGKSLIAPRYEGCKRFSEGLAPVRQNAKWGFIDVSGNLNIPTKYDDAEPFSEGLAAVSVGKKWGYIDATGKQVIVPKFLSAQKFSDGLAFVEVAENKFSCIEKTGKVQFAIEEVIVGVDDFKQGFAVVHKSSTAEYRNKKGEKIFGEFDRHSLSFAENLACVAVSKDGWNFSFGYMDEQGKLVVEPKYFRGGSFSEGLACVCIHEGEPDMLPAYPFGKWGYISKDGKLLIPATYDDAGNFHDGMAQIRAGKEALCGYINSKGESVIPARYSQGYDFSDGLALVRDGNQWKYLDKEGKAVISTDAQLCGNFHDGRAFVGYIQDKAVLEKSNKEAPKFAMPIHHVFDKND